MWKRYFSTLILLGTFAASRAQLAITEVMPSASLTFQTTNTLLQTSDWWELSNFGTNAIDLTGYKWNDDSPALGSGAFNGADPGPFQGLTIQPGESVLLVESNAAASFIATNAERFRTFWGLGPSVQIRLYSGNGLGSGGDSVRLWAPTAVNDFDLVDAVTLGTALRGSSFVYDTNTGVFAVGLYSTNGINGAFQAAQSDDIGSPGVNQGPVALSIFQQPTNLSVNPGDNAAFSAVVRGIPRPRFQWKFNDTDISGATLTSFTVTNVQTIKTGLYSVVVFNGFQTLTSSVATLVLNPAPEPPSVLVPPEDQTIYIGQNATFTIIASGVPQPRYQWRFNGGSLGATATNSSYTVTGATLGSSGIYSVVVSNSQGMLTNQATLTVTPRPNLVVTEVSSDQSTNGNSSGHGDWWELSNLDTFTVDLYHYQFDDGSQTRALAFTITNHILISPGESIVFVEGVSPNGFRKWWGGVNLKTNLQIIRYDGGGLSLSSLGDVIILWNPAAVDDLDYIAGVSFGAATIGLTFGYNPDTPPDPGAIGDPSVLGQYGAFQSVESDDIGSPGYLRTPPAPRVYRIVQSTGNDYQLTWYGLNNRTFAVEYKNDLMDATWSPLTTVTSTGPVTTATVSLDASPTGRRFIHLSLLP